MPFSTEISSYRGKPVLVVLCNGQPWGETSPTDPDFQFGKNKARMILAIRDLLDQFNRTEGQNADQIRQVIPNIPGLTQPLTVQGFAAFEAPNGHFIQQPYLQLKAGRTRLGLGVTKAQALLYVWKDIEAFANA
jgi:hypothetical protein